MTEPDLPAPPEPPESPRPPGRRQKHPFVMRCGPGKHAWCRCGASARYPLCDGTHRGSAVTPLKIVLEEAKTVVWCACGKSGNAPFCDGTHSSL